MEATAHVMTNRGYIEVRFKVPPELARNISSGITGGMSIVDHTDPEDPHEEPPC